MPRDGSGVYTQPFPPVLTATPVESSVYNGFVDDVEQDLNAPRPVVAGGTGANNATDAMVTLGGEIASQVVTNYNSYVFKAGSFYSDVAATGAPTPTGKYTGIVTVIDADNKLLRAFNHSTGAVYNRLKTAGVWGAWALELADVLTDIEDLQDAVVGITTDITALEGVDTTLAGLITALDTAKLNKSGGTMTGALTLAGAPSTDLHASTKKYVDDLIAAVPGGASASNATPTMNSGAGTAGAATTYARGDHVHPDDTSKADASHTHAQSDITGLTAALAAKSDVTRAIGAYGSNYTLAIGDAGALVSSNAAGAVNLTVPPNSSVAFPTGTQIDLVQFGAGQVTVVPGSGVTIYSADSKLKFRVAYSTATLVKVGTDAWLLTGDLTT